MTPAARLQAAIEVLAEVETSELPADRLLKNWFHVRRYAGSKDRTAIAERVYDVLRHRAALAWRIGNVRPRSLVLASLLAEGKSVPEVQALFSGEPYAPDRLTEAELAALAHPPNREPPLSVRGEFPEWLTAELVRAFGDSLLPEMQAFAARASIDLRVNRLRARREEMLTGLRGLGIACQPTPHSPDGIRIAPSEGLSRLQQTAFFESGAFEIQDEASQIVALLCDARPGMRVLDIAAGAGGKTLALAATMRNRGEILAFDDHPARLKALKPRARRAGASIVRVAERRGGPLWGNGKFDVVLADVPCSGSGTWRRYPEAKWRLTRERLDRLISIQTRLIDDAARHTRAGGRLIYATCSVLACENEAVVEAFLLRRKGFRVIPAAEVWHGLGRDKLPGKDQYFRASPAQTGTDGFFAAIIEACGQSD